MRSIADDKEKQPQIDGMVGARENLVFGWIIDLNDRDRKLSVEILVEGQSIGIAPADRHIEVAAHGAQGHYGFALYHSHAPEKGSVEISAREAESKTPLRWKRQPLISSGERIGPPLAIDGVKIAEKVSLTGRVGAYPGKHVGLEIYRRGERLKADIPLTLPKSGGTFEVEVSPELLQEILSNETEVGLPGLKEAGLAIPLRDLIVAAVTPHGGKLKIELSGKLEISGQVPLKIGLSAPGIAPVHLPALISERTSSVPIPEGFSSTDLSVEICIGDTAVPTELRHEFVTDRQFQSLGQPKSPWCLSTGSQGERGFFAFPSDLSKQYHLSGDIARVTRASPCTSFNLKQFVRKEAAKKDVIVVMARASKGAQISARFAAEPGTLSEESTTVDSDLAWHLLKLEIEDSREIPGSKFWFEVEATGENIEVLELAIGDPSDVAPPAKSVSGNVLSNPDLELWPEGVGIRQHSCRGEIAAAWRLLNKDCSEPVFTRAIVHPADSAIGLAVAAPHVKKWLRLEADFAPSPALSETMLVNFRAGIPAAARQLLANQLSPVPEFTVIHAITIIRRIQPTDTDSSSAREKVIARSARKITIRHDVEKFAVPIVVDLQREKIGDKEPSPKESYHLAFEFGEPAVLGLFDVEVLPQSAAASSDGPLLQLEDSSIELQIPKLVGLEGWISGTAAEGQRPVNGKARPLKWSVDASREPVEIVIPIFNALPETLACLESLIGSTRVPTLVRLVDDGSEEPVRQALETFARDKPWVELYSLGTNRGYTYAADFGVRLAQSEWVVLLNSDTILTRGWLEGLLACARYDSRTALVGPVSNAATFQSVPELYEASGKWKVNTLPPGMTPEDMAAIIARVSQHAYPEVPLLNGFCTLIRRATFLELGGLNIGAFPMGYGEENDLCLRAGKAGYKLAVADDVYVYHVKSASFGSARRTELSKAGNSALRELHPEVDINGLTKQFRDTLPLVALRKAVRRELAAGSSSETATGSGSDELLGTNAEPANPRKIQKA